MGEELIEAFMPPFPDVFRNKNRSMKLWYKLKSKEDWPEK